MPEFKKRAIRHQSDTLAQLLLPGGTLYPALVENVSETGACISVPAAAAADTAKALRGDRAVHLTVSERSIQLAKVVHSQRSSRVLGGGGARIGVQFTPPNAASSHTIDELKANPIDSRHAPYTIARQEKEQASHFARRLCNEFDCSFPLENIFWRVAVHSLCDHVEIEPVAEPPRRGRESYTNSASRSANRAQRIHFFRSRATGSRLTYLGCVELASTGMRAPHRGGALGQVTRALIELPGLENGSDCGFLPSHADRLLSGSDADILHAAPADIQLDKSLRSRTSYYVMNRDTITSLYGRRAHVTGIPYEQQSIVDGTCGQAALASASRVLAAVFRSWPLSQAEITEAAGLGFGADLPESGAAKVIKSLRYKVDCYFRDGSYGYVADVETKTKVGWSDLLDIIHCAIDSQLPPYLVFQNRRTRERHAVLAIGHTSNVIAGERAADLVKFAESHPGDALLGSRPIRTPEGKIYTTTDWVRSFLVHDNSVGPYLELPLRDPYEAPPTGKLTDGNAGVLWEVSAKRDIETVIVPLPPGVTLGVGPACRLARRYTVEFLSSEKEKDVISGRAGEEAKKLNALFRAQQDGNFGGVVVNVHLDHANRFRSMITAEFARANCDCPELRRMSLPRYVYVASIMLGHDLQGAASADAPVRGFLLLDSTASVYSRDAMLYAHLGEYVEYLRPSVERHCSILGAQFPSDMTQRKAWAQVQD